jgi:hypothetical protein
LAFPKSIGQIKCNLPKIPIRQVTFLAKMGFWLPIKRGIFGKRQPKKVTQKSIRQLLRLVTVHITDVHSKKKEKGGKMFAKKCLPNAPYGIHEYHIYLYNLVRT